MAIRLRKNYYQIFFKRVNFTPKCFKRLLTGDAKRRVCSCSSLPQLPGNEEDSVKGRSRKCKLMKIIWYFFAIDQIHVTQTIIKMQEIH